MDGARAVGNSVWNIAVYCCLCTPLDFPIFIPSDSYNNFLLSFKGLKDMKGMPIYSSILGFATVTSSYSMVVLCRNHGGLHFLKKNY